MRILISAYACEPGKGSEPGVGWNWALAAARHHNVWVLTRANNRPAIEQALDSELRKCLHFVYLDLPQWARFWKRGQRGVRTYYALWQLLAGVTARRLCREHSFDVVHHLTFANAWYPALAALAPAPFILGPVGGGPRVPLRLCRCLGLRGALGELRRGLALGVAGLNPLVRLAWRRAAILLAQNWETRDRLPRRYRPKAIVRPNACAALEPRGADAHENSARLVAVFAGRLLRWKGPGLAVQALHFAPGWELEIVGQGPERERLERVVEREGLRSRVRFIPWLDREELWTKLARSKALVLPSLRDDAPLVAAEAQALGVPVIAFDQGGPAAFGRLAGTHFILVELGSEDDCIRGLAAALTQLAAAPIRVETATFGLDAIARDLNAVYARAATTVRGNTRGVFA